MFCSSRRKQKKQQKINFQKHGSLLLEELIASSGGKYNPIRTFSSHQILQATNNFDWSYEISQDIFVWYKGTIENRAVLIKYYKYELFPPYNSYRDIAVSSMMSSHKNVLKLIGCCLEFPRPVLVCEYPEMGALTYRGGAGMEIKPLPWNVRLKIAKEIAVAVTYLHTEFPRTIIHRDLKLENVFMDKNWTAKLSSFGLSISIPEGESGVQDMVCGTTVFVEKQYAGTGFVTENVDIYNFGFIMLGLLTGKRRLHEVPTNGDSYKRIMLPDYVGEILERGPFTELIDPSMLNSTTHNIPDHLRLQMEAFLELALKCISFRPGENVPRMIEVAKELKKIEENHT
ncbi:PREDICTED: non-functional pseudokinase ZED1-like isoform X1 [Camelina sativa]|uniref:Non-functional pseudokinase ZED1-like isoform X1 n=1 Tax=Camelina sativa TaxID=90675 RepID=A0ABM0YR71_CAMSA|nr:PREDICTED: non-functional pseudokinase ZED1-like isoform X2 [Camelina sativa]XP_010504704.1 PREDICTED: non-functional pseudokinase ZED1-like isoform X1 [Camelina sativa]